MRLGRYRWLLLAALALGGLVLALGLLAGRGPGPVLVEGVPEPAGADRERCLRLAELLPAEVGDGLRRRDLVRETPFAAAWGHPAVVLRCGVAVPAGYSPASRVATVNGVDWYVDERRTDVVYTSVTRRPLVSVAFPTTEETARRLPFDTLVTIARPVLDATVASEPVEGPR